MTDEEMFKAWKSEQYKDQSTEERLEFVEHLHTFPKYFEKTFLAGLKAGRPQWHKPSEMLPKDEKDLLMSEQLILLTRMKGTDNLNISIGQYNFSTQEFSYSHIVGLTDVIAWCEIPTFDKE